jgi:hypothetical protein
MKTLAEPAENLALDGDSEGAEARRPAIRREADHPRTEPRRRASTLEATAVTRKRLAEVAEFYSDFGTYDIPRRLPYAALSKWVSKLKETYRSRADAARVRYVSQEAPAFHCHLLKWAATEPTRVVIHAPFWLQACWTASFMEISRHAPSQAGASANEVSLAKWLTRWSKDGALSSLAAAEQHVAFDLHQRGRALGSRLRERRQEAIEEAQAWRASDMYVTLAEMAVEGLKADCKGVFDQIAARQVFWPTRSEWADERSAWQQMP